MNPTSYMANLNNTNQAYAGEVSIGLDYIKAIKDIADTMWNDAMTKPISNVQRQTAFRQYQEPQAPLYQPAPIQPQVMQQPEMFGYMNQIQQPAPPVYTAPVNTQTTYFNPESIDNIGDIIQLVDKNKVSETTTTCGLTTPFTIAYKVSPVVFLVEGYNGATIHFNVAANKRIAKDRITSVYAALSSLKSYFDSMFNMCKSDLTAIELKDSDVVVTVQNVKMSLGTLALIKYRMEKAYWDAAQVNISGYLITASNGYLTIQKDTYAPVSIDLAWFKNVVNQLPALNVLTLNDDIFRMYQDDPKELTTRLIIELNKAMNKYEIITYEDICVLDSTIGTQIKNSLLGKQLKLSENIE